MDPLDLIKARDKELYSEVKNFEALAFQEGELSSKVKILMALSIDASHGSVEGVKALCAVAKSMGATDTEINEAIRVAGYVSGAAAIYTFADALVE